MRSSLQTQHFQARLNKDIHLLTFVRLFQTLKVDFIFLRQGTSLKEYLIQSNGFIL